MKAISCGLVLCGCGPRAQPKAAPQNREQPAVLPLRTWGLLKAPGNSCWRACRSDRSVGVLRCKVDSHVARAASVAGLGPADETDVASSPSNVTTIVGIQFDREALLRLARPHNFIPSMLLVVLGAWTGTGRSLHALSSLLRSPAVWIMALVAGGVAVASCVVNDYFDFESGVDVANSPDKPIPSGQVQADKALLFAFLLYVAVLAAACWEKALAVRMIISWSALVTVLYTPLLKRLTLVKNLVVAVIVAASPLAGALAAGAQGADLRTVMAPALFVFSSIMFREILMDVNDRKGDEQADVRTLPVVMGPRIAVEVAGAIALCSGAYGLYVAMSGAGLSWLWVRHGLPELAVRSASSLALLAVVAPMLRACLDILRSNYDHQVVGAAISGSRVQLALGMVFMALMA